MTDTLITTPFGFDSTAAEVIAGIDLSGKRAIVTGGSSGIGVETARALAGAGAEVTLAVRDTGAGERVASDIDGDVHVGRLDLSDQASVRAFAAAWDGPLHILVNNAGVMALPELQRSPEGWELQFATNHLGHFALALGLHDALAAAGGARIVSLSSVGAPARARSTSTTCTSSAASTTRCSPTRSPRPPTSCSPSRPSAAGRRRDHGQRGPPGRDHRLQPLAPPRPRGARDAAHLRHLPLQDPRSRARRRRSSSPPGRRSTATAATTSRTATRRPSSPRRSRPWAAPGVASYAIDPVDAERLWEVSEALIG